MGGSVSTHFDHISFGVCLNWPLKWSLVLDFYSLLMGFGVIRVLSHLSMKSLQLNCMLVT